ncbi:MAG: PLP-dependent aminotransferase family protein [Pseudomonadota bacterium]|nr:PLP-dependent aminotransferase family protein [Pseudomonadota bacterium]
MSHSSSHASWVIEALALTFATDAEGTLSHRLYMALRNWIVQGDLPQGCALPSSRRLASTLGVGRNTVLAAVERLSAEGFVVSRPGAGLYVARLDLHDAWPRDVDVAASLPSSEPTAIPYSNRGQQLLASCGAMDGQRRAFTPGMPAIDQFPRELWQRLLKRHQHRADDDVFGYATGGGHGPLREALCDYLRLSRSVRCHPHQILITQGAQQAFELVTRLLADPGDRAWVEDPGYAGAKACFASSGLELTPVPVDDEGLKTDAADSAKPPRLIYATPSHQYPSGATMSMARRLALLECARRHGAYIIEDDYDSEFRYTTPPLASLQGLAGGDPVIYVGTFSKVLYPGLRLGYLVLPEPLFDDFRRANARLHREGQYVAQAALADFIKEGHFSRHVARMRRCYRERQACLRQALAPAVAAGLSLSSGQSGMHLVAHLDSVAQEQQLIRRAHEAGITLSALSDHYLCASPKAGLVLGYAGSTPVQLEQAGSWLATAWLAQRGGKPATTGSAAP